MAQEPGRRTLHHPDGRELSVEELDEVAGGAAAANGYCPVSNKEGCNTQCKPAVESAGTA